MAENYLQLWNTKDLLQHYPLWRIDKYEWWRKNCPCKQTKIYRAINHGKELFATLQYKRFAPNNMEKKRNKERKTKEACYISSSSQQSIMGGGPRGENMITNYNREETNYGNQFTLADKKYFGKKPIVHTHTQNINVHKVSIPSISSRGYF